MPLFDGKKGRNTSYGLIKKQGKNNKMDKTTSARLDLKVLELKGGKLISTGGN
jgi:hypothetical protein